MLTSLLMWFDWRTTSGRQSCVVEYTHASSVRALPNFSVSDAARTASRFPPVNARPKPEWPVSQLAPLTNLAVLPLPDESADVDPLPSLNAKAARGTLASAGLRTVHDTP